MLTLRAIRQKLSTAKASAFNTIRTSATRPISSNRIGIAGAVIGGGIGEYISAKDTQKKKMITMITQLESTCCDGLISKHQDLQPLNPAGTAIAGGVVGYVAGQMLCRTPLALPILFSTLLYLDMKNTSDKNENEELQKELFVLNQKEKDKLRCIYEVEGFDSAITYLKSIKQKNDGVREFNRQYIWENGELRHYSL